MKSKEMSVVFSSDNNYASHMGAAIYSLLEKNKAFEKIDLYIIDNEISVENKNKLESVVSEFENASVSFIDFSAFLKKLELNMSWQISVSSYARLFVSNVLPQSVKRALYLDCDMIVTASLEKLWNTDLGENTIGAVCDAVSDETKGAVGLKSTQKYFNAGMLLIDLEKWRERQTEKRCLEFIKAKNGCVLHHDQGVLNGVLKNETKFLPLENNVMTIHYIFSKAQINLYFKNNAEFYSEEEIEKAKQSPVILHFTPSFTTRPWVKGCKHPKKALYWNALSKTPWNGMKEQKDTRKFYVKLIEWRFRCLPYG